MGRAPCCDQTSVKRGPWSPEEDATLRSYLERHGISGNWIALPQKAGLKRCGKSCRLRWLNYLRPNIKHGGFTQEEDNIIFSLYKSIGSRWSIIASQLHGRTDNDVKNYWNSKLKKKILTAGETNTRHFAPDPTADFHFVSPSPPPPPQPQVPTIKSEAFLSSSLPPGCFDFNIPCILHSYQTPPILQQLPADVVAIGYNTPPVAEDASVGSAASSSVTTDNTGDASFLSELESSWTDLLLASFSEGGHQLPAAQEIGFLTNGEMI
ncbi:hypothetical protein HPP92_026509 [Vanilla planifolia]|uniref:Uncharacterized protein n=1 Tax=Vanilla planifolia TaxID=51239 RepID=A0A835PCS0_VANPL|nr:hypothetical protein HPP92_026509 [Vanilla planifolia]